MLTTCCVRYRHVASSVRLTKCVVQHFGTASCCRNESKGRWSADFPKASASNRVDVAVKSGHIRVLGKKQMVEVRGQLIYGLHACRAALVNKSRSLYHIYPQLVGGNSMPIAIQNDIVSQLSPTLMERVSLIDELQMRYILKMQSADFAVHQGIIIDASPLKPTILKSDTFELRDAQVARDGKTPLWVFVENITNVREFGAVLRSCYFLGVERIILPQMELERYQALTGGESSKTSSGALEQLHLCQLSVAWSTQAFLKAAAEQFTVVYSSATDADCTPLAEAKLTEPQPILLVVQDGATVASTVEECDLHVGLPAQHRPVPNKPPVRFPLVENVTLPLTAKISTILEHFVSSNLAAVQKSSGTAP